MKIPFRKLLGYERPPYPTRPARRAGYEHVSNAQLAGFLHAQAGMVHNAGAKQAAGYMDEAAARLWEAR